jgi:riboflavin kinase/FMN adenylyltransferase
VVSIGNFDGVHRGHAALLARLRAQADSRRAAAVVVTFDPPPLRLLRPNSFQPTLTTLAERCRLIQESGADHVLVLQTTHELLRLSAAEFFNAVLRERLAARGLVEGPNFGFGRDREGDVGLLARYCEAYGLGLDIAPPVYLDGDIVSSSRVRQALLAGEVDAAAHWLGRPYRIEGTVGVGQRRGQQLGIPTANLAHVPTLIPADGVYACRARYGDRSWPAAANVGPNPTFDEQARKVEVHLIGFAGDLYGQALAVEFLARLRATQKFPSPQALLAQMRADIARAREIVRESSQ